MEKNDQDILEILQEIIEKRKTQTYETIKWENPITIVGKIISIKEVESIFGGTNRLFVIEYNNRKYGFFDSSKSLKTQLRKLSVSANDIIYVNFKGIDSFNGRTFKSFVVYKYLGNHKWLTSNGKEVIL